VKDNIESEVRLTTFAKATVVRRSFSEGGSRIRRRRCRWRTKRHSNCASG